MTTEIGSTTLLDFRGMSCPLPIAKTAQALRALAPGDVVTVRVTDAGALRDFPAWCRTTGNELLDTTQLPHEITFRIRKKG